MTKLPRLVLKNQIIIKYNEFLVMQRAHCPCAAGCITAIKTGARPCDESLFRRIFLWTRLTNTQVQLRRPISPARIQSSAFCPKSMRRSCVCVKIEKGGVDTFFISQADAFSHSTHKGSFCVIPIPA